MSEFSISLNKKDLEEFNKILDKGNEELVKDTENAVISSIFDLQRLILENNPPEVTGRLNQSLGAENVGVFRKSDDGGVEKEFKNDNFYAEIYTNIEYAQKIEYDFCETHQVKHSPFSKATKKIEPFFNNRLKKIIERWGK